MSELRQRRPRLKIPKILAHANGQPCTVRHPTYCIGRHDTVAAHANWLDCGKGVGLRVDDYAIAFACSGCHAWLDKTREADRRDYWLRGHLETLRILFEDGVIK